MYYSRYNYHSAFVNSFAEFSPARTFLFETRGALKTLRLLSDRLFYLFKLDFINSKNPHYGRTPKRPVFNCLFEYCSSSHCVQNVLHGLSHGYKLYTYYNFLRECLFNYSFFFFAEIFLRLFYSLIFRKTTGVSVLPTVYY